MRKLLWKSWGDEHIVYNLLSGNTHLLNPTAAQALKILEQKPSNLLSLTSHIASSIGIEPDEELIKNVETLLANLDELGLIEPALI